MSERKDRGLRKLVKYNPADDPIHKRKYAMVVCKKVIGTSRAVGPSFARCGAMLANKGKRLQYRAAKKLYKAGLLPKAKI